MLGAVVMDIKEQTEYWLQRRQDAMTALEYANSQLEQIGALALKQEVVAYDR